MNGTGSEEFDSKKTTLKQDIIPIGCLVFIISVIVGICFVIWQIHNWAKTGAWISLPLSTAFRYYGYDLDSVYNPQNWIGLAKIAQWLLKLPISLCIPIIVGGISYLLYAITNKD
jgi:hypothetical protein